MPLLTGDELENCSDVEAVSFLIWKCGIDVQDVTTCS